MSDAGDSDDSDPQLEISTASGTVGFGISPQPKRRVRHRNILPDSKEVKLMASGQNIVKEDLSKSSFNKTPKGNSRQQKNLVVEIDSDSSFVTANMDPPQIADRGDGAENLSSGGRNSLRRNKKKSTMKSRRMQRDHKRGITGDFGTPDYMSLSLPSSGHYRSLVFNKSASAIDHDDEDVSLTADEEAGFSTPRKPSLKGASALDDRGMFYKNFSMLVQMGERAMQRQDIQRAVSADHAEGHHPGGLYVEPRQRTLRRSSGSASTVSRQMVSFGDYLWLNLQAWLSGKCMKSDLIKSSLEQIDDELIEKRNQNLVVLKDIKDFVFTESLHRKSQQGSPDVSSNDLAPDIDQALAQFDALALVEPECSAGGKNEIFNTSFVELQSLALKRVCKLLKRYEELESLFPNRKAFLSNHRNEFTPDLDEKLTVIQIWYNVTRDLCRKIKIIGRLLEMHKAKDKLEWPNLDYESPANSRSGSPCNEISISAISVNNSDSTAALLSPGPTSPSSGHSSSNHINRSVSDMEFVTTATMYKQFVEKSLKLRGMRKALSRMGDTLGSTLWRTRQALQKRSVMSTLSPTSTPNKIPKINTSLVNEFSTKNGIDSMANVKHADDSRHSHHVTAKSMTMQSTGKFNGLLTTPRTVSSPGSSISVVHPKSTMHQSSSNTNLDYMKQLLLRQSNMEYDMNLLNFGVNNEVFKATRLPSYYPSFLFLLRVPLNLVHEWLKLRIEQKSNRNPDPVTLEQLIQDCQDCLAGAVEVKCFYQEHVQATTVDNVYLQKLLIDDISEFEADLQKMFDIYLDYVRLWAKHQTTLHQMPTEWSQSMINRLEEEWKFAKKIAINILSGEADAARRFCYISNEMYASIEEMMDKLIEKVSSILYDDENSEDENSNHSPMSSLSEMMIEKKPSRAIRLSLTEIRDRSLRALTFSKLLRNDLEISTKYDLKCDQSELLEKLLKTNHYLLQTANFSPDFMMFSKDSVASNDDFVQLLLNVTCGRDGCEVPAHISNEKGCILLMKCGDSGCQRFSSKWHGRIREIVPNADTNLALHNLEVDGFYLVVSSSDKLREQRSQLEKVIGPEYLELVNEQCSCHGMIAENMQEMKYCALKLRQKLVDWLCTVQKDFYNTEQLETYDENERQSFRDVLIHAYNFAFEYHKELVKMVTGETKVMLIDSIRQFAHQWSDFVQQICARGHGLRPRWATDGFNFLVFAADPLFTRTFSDDTFAELKKTIDQCIHHVIGSRPEHLGQLVDANEGVHRAISWPPTKLEKSANYNAYANVQLTNNQDNVHATLTVPMESRRKQALSEPGTCSDPETPACVDGDEQVPDAKSTTICRRDLHERIMTRLSGLEADRDNMMVKERRIGKCRDKAEIRPHRQMALKRANFKWQRLNNKIGAGKFGSVYTAINLDSGQLMAMKQIRFQIQDHQSMQSLVDEVTNFEGIRHENLVRYYGVEVHRDELFIFMEFCNEGTLEKLCKEGLTEDSIRTYTLHLLLGVCELHRRGIVHRDIKTANIFLTNEYQTVKLGDFGSSVRLRETTTVAGELTQYVGTPAYMAPEVCTSNQDGYGRAADIWSVGCVVLEMATGKAPWHDLTNTFSIIWKVGNGATPSVPDTLSMDCKDFLFHCFQSHHLHRWSAEQLMEHRFVKVLN